MGACIVRVGDKLAELANGFVVDTSIAAKSIHSEHETLAQATEAARLFAESGTSDAAVVAHGDRFIVVETDELGRLAGRFTSNQLNEARAGVVAFYAGDRVNGVSLKKTSDRTTQLERLGQTLERAGVPAELAQRIATDGKLTPGDAELVAQAVLAADETGKLADYGPRVFALRLADRVVGEGATLRSTQLVRAMQVAEHLVTLRPHDATLVRVLDGEPLQRVGKLEVGADGTARAGAYAAGQLYVDSMGVYFAADERGQRTGGPLGEQHLDKMLLGNVLDGVERSIEDVAHGIYAMLTEPVRTLEGLARLPTVVADALRNSPSLWERFCVMPADVQAREATRIAVGGGMAAAGLFRLARLGKVAAKSPPPASAPAVSPPAVGSAPAPAPANVGPTAGGAARVSAWGEGWPRASLPQAIERHAGSAPRQWNTATGKTIYENPLTGRQVVVDGNGYFRIFQPNAPGSVKGKYLDLEGNIPTEVRRVKSGAQKPVPLEGDLLKQRTHFLFAG